MADPGIVADHQVRPAQHRRHVGPDGMPGKADHPAGAAALLDDAIEQLGLRPRADQQHHAVQPLHHRPNQRHVVRQRPVPQIRVAHRRDHHAVPSPRHRVQHLANRAGQGAGVRLLGPCHCRTRRIKLVRAIGQKLHQQRELLANVQVRAAKPRRCRRLDLIQTHPAEPHHGPQRPARGVHPELEGAVLVVVDEVDLHAVVDRRGDPVRSERVRGNDVRPVMGNVHRDPRSLQTESQPRKLQPERRAKPPRRQPDIGSVDDVGVAHAEIRVVTERRAPRHAGVEPFRSQQDVVDPAQLVRHAQRMVERQHHVEEREACTDADAAARDRVHVLQQMTGVLVHPQVDGHVEHAGSGDAEPVHPLDRPAIPVPRVLGKVVVGRHLIHQAAGLGRHLVPRPHDQPDVGIRKRRAQPAQRRQPDDEVAEVPKRQRQDAPHSARLVTEIVERDIMGLGGQRGDPLRAGLALGHHVLRGARADGVELSTRLVIPVEPPHGPQSQGPVGSLDLLHHKLQLVAATRMMFRRDRIVVAQVVVGQMTQPIAVGRKRLLDLGHQRRRRVEPLMVTVVLRRQRHLLLVEELVRHHDHQEPANPEHAEPVLQGVAEVRDVLQAVAREHRVLRLLGKRQSPPVIAWKIQLDPDGLRHDRHHVGDVALVADVKDGLAREIGVDEPVLEAQPVALARLLAHPPSRPDFTHWRCPRRTMPPRFVPDAKRPAVAISFQNGGGSRPREDGIGIAGTGHAQAQEAGRITSSFSGLLRWRSL